MRRVSGLAATLVIALAAVACESKHHANIGSIADCLGARRARVFPQPPGFEKAARQRGWMIRRFQISARNAVNVLSTRSDSAASDAYRRITKAIAAVDDDRPHAQRRARLVYWWDEPPTAAERRIFSRCIRT
jgi:hypothetical protein